MANNGNGQGTFIVGEYLSIEAPRKYQKPDGADAVTWAKLRLLVDDDVLIVEYPDVQDIPQAALDAKRGDSLTVAVTASGGFVNGRRQRASFNGAISR